MKRYSIILIIVTFCSFSPMAQNEYYDATKLKSMVTGNVISANGAKILLKYFPLPQTIDNVNDSLKALNDSIKLNPFLESFRISTTTEHSFRIGEMMRNKGVAGLDVTNLAHGISQFMIERAKQELTVAFFNRFKKFAEEHEEFAILFPVTTDNLENLLAYSYPEMLPALRSGFLDDIKLITYHLDDVLELPKYHELLKNFPEIKVAIRSIRVVHGLESGETHPADLFEEFASFEEWNDLAGINDFKNFGSVVKLANLFSGSLRDIEDEASAMTDDTSAIVGSVDEITQLPSAAWISFRQMKMLVEDEVTFKLYLGLFYQKVKNTGISFSDADGSVSFHEIMRQHKDNLFLFENKVTEFIELANKVDITLDTLKDKRTGRVALSNDELYSYIDVSLDVMEYGFSLGRLFSENLNVDDYCKIARKANELYRNIYKQEYTQAISNAADILDEINFLITESRDRIRIELDTTYKGHSFFKKPIYKLSEEESNALASFKPVLNSGRSESLLEKYKALRETNDSFSKFSSIVAKTTRYGLFMANMVKAESADEVSALLESTVLPVGSSSIKKNSTFNMAIQSYLGGFAGLNVKEEDDSAWNTPFGVIAPIGLSLSAGLGKGGAFSLFFPLLDIGAVVDYQLKGNSIPSSTGGDSIVISKDYSIKLGQILSPGVYFVWGLPWNIPLSLGFGTQYGPGLGKLDDDANPIVNNPRWRANAFLAVDIPFYNLVNVPKKYTLE
ncbi:MAG: hypothetical protein ABIQ11_09325 [Saprospiraceae bacterium]